MENWTEHFYSQNSPSEIYFDNAATTQKLQVVVEAITSYYHSGVAAYGRGAGPLNTRTRVLFTEAKQNIAQYFGLRREQLIITKSATEALNLAIYNLGKNFQAGDIVLLSVYEHNSVFVPLKRLAEKLQLELKLIPILPSGELDLTWLENTLSADAKNAAGPKIRLVTASATSNVLGVNNDLTKLSKILKLNNKKRQPKQHLFSLVDNAARMLSGPFDFNQFDFDLMAVSFHKMYGPAQGALLVRPEILSEKYFGPRLIGGGIVGIIGFKNSFSEMLVSDKEQQFLAGVPDTASLLAASAATTWLAKFHLEHLNYLKSLTAQLYAGLQAIPGVKILGEADASQRTNLISLVHENFRASDMAGVLAGQGVDVRVGRHCADVLYEFLNLPEALRFSLAVYNTPAQVEKVLALMRNLPQQLYQSH